MSEQIPATLAELRVPIGDVRPYARNPRRGDVDRIAASLAANGQYRPIVVNRRTGEVLAGNHTYRAAVQLGWQHIAATFVDVDDEQAARIVVADNRLADLAGYDTDRLLELLAEATPDELPAFGYVPDEVDELLRLTGRTAAQVSSFLDDYATPPAPPQRPAPVVPQSPAPPAADPAPAAAGAAGLEADHAGVPAALAPSPQPAAEPLPAAPAVDYVPVSWTVTLADRDTIRAALRLAQDRHGLPTAAEALVAVCRDYTEGADR